jgi:hypothetical protein
MGLAMIFYMGMRGIFQQSATSNGFLQQKATCRHWNVIRGPVHLQCICTSTATVPPEARATWLLQLHCLTYADASSAVRV